MTNQENVKLLMKFFGVSSNEELQNKLARLNHKLILEGNEVRLVEL